VENQVLQLTLTSDRAQAVPGQAVTYIVRVRNTTTSDMAAMTVVTTLPAGVTVNAATSSQGQAQQNASAGTVTLALPSLAAGQEAVLTIQAQFPAGVAAGASAVARAQIVDVGAGCIEASTSTTIVPAGIPVTGGGPGLRELQLMLLAGLSGSLAVLWSSRQLIRRLAVLRAGNRRE
jgi:uncharacterized repeat protein (TIGR01451 family)